MSASRSVRSGPFRIRAGDAGALRVMIAGQDQGTLGRDGEVVSRTFTVQPARPQPVR